MRPLTALLKNIATVISLCTLTGCVAVPPDTTIASRHNGDSTARHRAEECAPAPTVAVQGNPGPDSASASDRTFSLLSWNIYKAQRPGWEIDLRRFADGKDLVLLQEAISDVKFLDTLNGSGIGWEMVHAFQINDTTAGVLTGARIAPAGSCGLRVAEPVIRLPKSVLVSRFPISGSAQPLVVANLHGINSGFDGYRRQLARLREVLAGHTGPLLVVGDFNTWSAAREKVVADFAVSLGLRQANLRRQPSRFFGRVIDHIFYRGLEMLDSGAVPVTSSDHDPLMATFRLARGNPP
jgi:endonuclease/exonuclease/phosphatase (EEP) superfamily protein YafD